jgi:hypothetical protein
MALSENTPHYEYSVIRILMVYCLFRFSDRLDFNEMSFTSLKERHCVYSMFQQSTEISATISADYVLGVFYMGSKNCQILETIG